MLCLKGNTTTTTTTSWSLKDKYAKFISRDENFNLKHLKTFHVQYLSAAVKPRLEGMFCELQSVTDRQRHLSINQQRSLNPEQHAGVYKGTQWSIKINLF